MVKLDTMVGDVIFISFSNIERYSQIGIKNNVGHYKFQGYDSLGLWIEHPGIVLNSEKDDINKNIDANFLVRWEDINTIMHYPGREEFDFPNIYKKSIGFKIDNNIDKS